MSPLETEFRQSCKECIDVGTKLGLSPAEIISQLNALLSKFNGKAANAGLTDDLATSLHGKLVKAISEIVPLVAIYEGPISGAEHSILTFFRNESARCIPKRGVALGIDEEFQPEFQNALLSLYRRGLVRDGEQNITICLTAAGEGYVDGLPLVAGDAVR